MITLEFDIRDGATPRLKKVLERAEPHQLASTIAPRCGEHWRDHLASLPRNKRGFPSTGFWEEAARRVVAVAVDGVVVLSCDKVGVRKRLFGGPVKAVNKKYVTVPLTAEAAGTTAKDWGQALTLVILADGRKFLALWLGNAENRSLFEKTVGTTLRKFRKGQASGLIQAHAAERSAKAARKYSYGEPKVPKVIIFKGSGGTSKAEKHGDLKFLYRLMEETGDQAPMPQVVPPDLNQVALKAAKEALQVL